MTDLSFWTYGTGGPLMWAAIGLLVLAAVFGYLVKKWAEELAEIPLNYVAEERYRPAYRSAPTGPTNFSQIWAASASTAVAYIPGAVWPVADPRQIVEYKRHLERVAWLPEVGS